MRRWTVGKRIAVGYAVLLALLATAAGVGTFALSDTRSTFRSAIRVQEQEAIRALEANAAFQNAGREFRGFLLLGNKTFLKSKNFQIANARRTAAVLRDTSGTAKLRAGWGEVLRLFDAWDEATQAAVAAKTAGREGEALRIFREQTVPAATRASRLVISFADSEKTRAKHITQSASNTSSRLFWVLIIVAAVALASGIGVAWALARSITGRLRETIETLAAASAEIVAATTQQVAGATEEEAAVHETSASVEEIKQTTEVAADKARAVAESVRKTAEISENGRQAVEQSVTGSQEAKARMEALAERILALSEQAQAIGEITASVNDLAEQSNLLAVNAGIEAAKAGEAGKGFTVVAEEVKALAEQSKQATAEIREILGEVQRATQAAVMAAEQGVKASVAGETVANEAGEAIRLLAQSLTESAQAAQQIQASAQQQMTGMDQVGLAMQNIQQASAQNISSTRQVEQAAQDLNTLAGRLTELVRRSRDHGSA